MTAPRLVGIGRRTAGLSCFLETGTAVVIGRHTDCTLVVKAGSSGPGQEQDRVSRQHAVVEEQPGTGWCVHDSGSLNGTAILAGGLPPAIRIGPGEPHRLRAEDVIELAGDVDCRFRFTMAETAGPRA